ncbi:MAG: chromosome segregation ATPase [Bradymonadia bacterium]|jgi:chromosome segregation ATPase
MKSNESVEGLLESGLNALDAGNFDDALSQWNLALNQEPGNARAARLVADLEQLISDNRRGTMTIPSGEFVVVVEDDDIELELEAPERKAMTQVFLDKQAADLAELSAENEALDGQVSAANAIALEARKSAVAAEGLLAELKAGQIADAEARAALDVENRDHMRFRRLQRQQVADLELRMAERQAHEKTVLAEIDQRAAERDALKAELEAGAAALKEANDATSAAVAERDAQKIELEAAALLTAERDSITGELEALIVADAEKAATITTLNESLKATSEEIESIKAELDEMRNALTSERAGGDEVREALASVREEAATVAATLAEAQTTVRSAETTIHELEADKAAVEAERAELEKGKAATDEALELAAIDAKISADGVTRLAAELAKAAAEAEEKITVAASALEESQTARSAMRTEMATIVQDLEKAKTQAKQLRVEAEAQQADLATSGKQTGEALAAAEAKAVASEAEAAELAGKIDAAEKAAEDAKTKVAELEVSLAEEKKTREHSAANTAAQAATKISAAHKAVSAAEAAAFSQAAEISRLGAALEAAKAAAPEESAAQAVAEATQNATLLSGQVSTLKERVAQLENTLADTESNSELGQRLKEQDDALVGFNAQMMARDASIAELQAQLETRQEAHAAQTNATSVRAAERDAQVTELEGQLHEIRVAIAGKDIQLQELEGQVRLASRTQETPSLQAEVDRLNVALSASEGRARSADEYVEEMEAQVEKLKASPIDMYISGSYLGASERSLTPSENVSISGQFAAAEAETKSTGPPPIPQGALGSQSGSTVSTDTPIDSSAVTRLRDESLSAAERLSWLIDEQPYLAKDSTSSRQTLSAQAAFVLQMIDGVVSFADLIDIVGLPADETYAILLDLWERGVITSPSLEP